jgi:transcriptional regulator with XRE-family HTH domain
MANLLGDYLRARRAQVRPEELGLVSGGQRRVPGLRREELAGLVGISSDYYMRLEQGRGAHPSAEVLAALARALRLDVRATEHLYLLAGSTNSDHPLSAVETIVNGVDQLITQFPMPAIVANRFQDVLASNPSARALSPGFNTGQNFLRWRVLDPAARGFFVDWDEATDVAVSGLREAAGTDLDHPRLRQLIDELAGGNERFRALWARADVGYRTGIIHMNHPQVGDLHLHRNRLKVPHSGGQHVLLYYPEPGSASAATLKELRSLPTAANVERELPSHEAPDRGQGSNPTATLHLHQPGGH